MIVLKVDSMIKVKVKNHMPRDSNYLAAGEAFPRTPDATNLTFINTVYATRAKQNRYIRN